MKLTARWILLDIPPGSSPPCTARVGFESTTGEVQALGDVLVSPCRDVPDAVDRCLAVLAELGLAGVPLMLVYPRYQVADALEMEMHQIAWVIKDEADRRGFAFARELPQPTRHLPA